MSPRAFGIRLSIFYSFLFLGLGIQLPFLPLWLSARGFAPEKVALVLAAMTAIRAASAPFGTYLADRLAARRAVMIAAACAAFLFYALLSQAHGFAAILALAVLAAALFSPVVPLTESLAVEGASARGLDYGRLRLWGSLSFLAGSAGCGALLGRLPVSWAAELIAAAYGILALASFSLPREPQVPHGSVDASQPATSLRRLVLSPVLVVFLLASSLGQASHAMLYSFGSVHWNALGYGNAAIGQLWAGSIVAEVVLFAFSGRVLALARPVSLIAIGTAGGLVRWLLLATDPGLAGLAIGQVLHALSFALTHLAAVHFIHRHVPAASRNTVQGIYAALSGGVMMAFATWLSGPLYAAHGGKAYLAMAVLAGVACGLALLLARLTPTAPRMAGT